MPGAGQGLIRAFATLLTLQPSSSVNASPLTAYGPKNGDSGMALNEAMNFSKWTFSGTGNGSGYTVSLYGTSDPLAYAAWKQSINPGMYPGGPVTCPASSWFQLPAPAEQSGTGTVSNPLVAATGSVPFFQYSGVLLAVRAVLTAVNGSQTGTFTINCQAVP